MKTYVITGSLGNISKPVIEGLLKAGHNVKVISSSTTRSAEIEKLGAKALVGSVADVEFVATAFKGADVVYTMIPPIWQTENWRASQNEVAQSYAEAIRRNGIKHVVNLSSIGAHVGNGVGPVDGVADLEKLLNAIPGLNVKHLRPSFFYHNFLAQVGLAKTAGIIGGNYGTGEKLFLVHPKDIANAALTALLNLNFTGISTEYIIGDERSGKEIASVIGQSIGKEINWVEFTDEQQKQGLLGAGLSETHAEGYTTMGKALREGVMQEDARKNKPSFASIKLEDFAQEFARAYNSSN
jgi:uncharacterized protein YbjT (DUF2867 family)